MAQARFEDLATFEARYIKDLKESCICPLTHEIMVTPVYYIVHGIKRYFEQSAITTWINENSICPVTGEPITLDMLKADPNRFARFTNLHDKTGEIKFACLLDEPAIFMAKEFIYTIRLGDFETFNEFKPHLTHYLHQAQLVGDRWPALHNAIMRRGSSREQLDIINVLLDAGAEIEGTTPGKLTPLLLAVQSKNLAIVQRLLEAGANPKAPASLSNLYPLDIAACDSHIQIAEMLLRRNLHVDASVGAGNTVLHRVVRIHGAEDMVRLLLKYGAKVNIVNKQGDTPLHYAVQTKNNEAVVALLLAADADITIENNDGKCASQMKTGNEEFYACSYRPAIELINSAKVRKKLIFMPSPAVHEIVSKTAPVEDPKLIAQKLELEASAAFKVNASIPVDSRSLYIAALNGHLKDVKALLAGGAHVNVFIAVDSTPLYVASQNGHAKVVKALLARGAHVNVSMTRRSTPLFVASQNGHAKVIKALLAGGAIVDATMIGGSTPLYVASQNGHVDVIKILIAGGANVNVSTAGGSTPLYKASQHGHVEVVKMLLAAEAKVNAPMTEGSTQLYVASQNGHAEVVNSLLARGANVNVSIAVGSTPLYVASQNGHTEVVKMLLASGAKVDVMMTGASTPLYIASQNGHTEVVKMLLASGAKVDVLMTGASTSLYVASQNGHTEVVKLLLANGAKVDVMMTDASTPLYVASQNGHTEIVTTLIAAGAKIHKPMADGSTPLSVALKNKHVAIIKELIPNGVELHKILKRIEICINMNIKLLSTWKFFTSKLPSQLHEIKYQLAGLPEYHTQHDFKLAVDIYTMLNEPCEELKRKPNFAAFSKNITSIFNELVSDKLDQACDNEFATPITDFSYTSLPELPPYTLCCEVTFLCACREGNISTVAKMLSYGVNPNLKDEEGKTGLIIAAMLHQNLMHKLLDFHNVDTTLEYKGKTAKNYAEENGWEFISSWELKQRNDQIAHREVNEMAINQVLSWFKPTIHSLNIISAAPSVPQHDPFNLVESISNSSPTQSYDFNKMRAI